MLAGPDQPGLEQCPGRPPPSLLGIRQGPDSTVWEPDPMSPLALDHTSLDGGGTVQWNSEVRGVSLSGVQSLL